MSAAASEVASERRFAAISEATGAIAPRDLLAPLRTATGLSLERLRGRHPAGKTANRFRHVGMYLLRTQAKWSYSEIGLYFDRRDHSTVINGCRVVAELIEADTAFARFVKDVEQATQSGVVVPSTLRRSAVLAAPTRGMLAEMRDLRADVAALREELVLLRKALEAKR